MAAVRLDPFHNIVNVHWGSQRTFSIVFRYQPGLGSSQSDFDLQIITEDDDPDHPGTLTKTLDAITQSGEAGPDHINDWARTWTFSGFKSITLISSINVGFGLFGHGSVFFQWGAFTYAPGEWTRDSGGGLHGSLTIKVDKDHISSTDVPVIISLDNARFL